MRILSGVLLILLGSNVYAGLVLEMVKRDMKTGKVSPVQKIQVQNGSGRFEGDDGTVTIFHADTLLHTDSRTKTYSVLDKKALAKLKTQMALMQEKMQASMGSMPPEQRAMLEQSMGQLLAPSSQGKLDVIDTRKTDRVEGRVCRVWQVKRRNQLQKEVCVVPYADLSAQGELQALMRSMSVFLETMAQVMPGGGDAMTEEMHVQTRVNGFPVRSREYANGKPGGEENVLKSWKTQELPAALFQPPSGYQRVEMMQAFPEDKK